MLLTLSSDYKFVLILSFASFSMVSI